MQVHNTISGSQDDSDITKLLSAFKFKGKPSDSKTVEVHKQYVFARANKSTHHLVDRRANAGLAGSDMGVIHKPLRQINVVGINDHELTALDVVTAARVLQTNKGPVLGKFHEYAHLGKGNYIHASGQTEWFKCKVDDKSSIVSGSQSIKALEGYALPIVIQPGLPYLYPLSSLTDKDLETLPHVVFPSPQEWDPTVFWTMG